MLKSSPVAVLVDEIEIIDRFKHIVVLYDVRTGIQVTENIDFVDCSLLQFWQLFEFIGLHHFDGDFLFGLDVNGTVDSGINPASQFVL